MIILNPSVCFLLSHPAATTSLLVLLLDQRTRGPEDRRTGGPGDQRTGGPGDHGTGGPGDQRTKKKSQKKHLPPEKMFFGKTFPKVSGNLKKPDEGNHQLFSRNLQFFCNLPFFLYKNSPKGHLAEITSAQPPKIMGASVLRII